jgi:antitoxin (DNA-binding transcriptional repressor) of toxin-antitoxin stability system
MDICQAYVGHIIGLGENLVQWNIAEAKQKFSAVLRASAAEPQQILNRGQVVAAVIDAKTFAAFEAWRQQQHTASLADVFAELRKLCEEENYTLTTPIRQDRKNTFTEAFNDGAM